MRENTDVGNRKYTHTELYTQKVLITIHTNWTHKSLLFKLKLSFPSRNFRGGIILSLYSLLRSDPKCYKQIVRMPRWMLLLQKTLLAEAPGLPIAAIYTPMIEVHVRFLERITFVCIKHLERINLIFSTDRATLFKQYLVSDLFTVATLYHR
jgi:hypothetical protein